MGTNKDIKHLNNLGNFTSIQAVWESHPEGGKEGDYLRVNGVEYTWNKYERLWETSHVATLSVTRRTETVYGDLNVHNNLTVGGTLRAKRLKSANRGVYASVEDALTQNPRPDVGDWFSVLLYDDSDPPEPTGLVDVYICTMGGEWPDEPTLSGIDLVAAENAESLESLELALTAETEAREAADAELEAAIVTIQNSVEAAAGSAASAQAAAESAQAAAESAAASAADAQTAAESAESKADAAHSLSVQANENSRQAKAAAEEAASQAASASESASEALLQAQQVSHGKADLSPDTGWLELSQMPHVVLRNVHDTMLDTLSVGDVYYDSGHLYLYLGNDVKDLGEPRIGVIYCHQDENKLYRWNGLKFVAVGGVSTSGGGNGFVTHEEDGIVTVVINALDDSPALLSPKDMLSMSPDCVNVVFLLKGRNITDELIMVVDEPFSLTLGEEPDGNDSTILPVRASQVNAGVKVCLSSLTHSGGVGVPPTHVTVGSLNIYCGDIEETLKVRYQWEYTLDPKPTNVGVQDGVVTLSSSAADAARGGVIEYRINGGEWILTDNSVVTVTLTEPGEYVIESRVVVGDNHGETTTTTVVIEAPEYVASITSPESVPELNQTNPNTVLLVKGVGLTEPVTLSTISGGFYLSLGTAPDKSNSRALSLSASQVNAGVQVCLTSYRYFGTVASLPSQSATGTLTITSSGEEFVPVELALKFDNRPEGTVIEPGYSPTVHELNALGGGKVIIIDDNPTGTGEMEINEDGTWVGIGDAEDWSEASTGWQKTYADSGSYTIEVRYAYEDGTYSEVTTIEFNI